MKGLKKCPMVWLPGSETLPPGPAKDLVLAAEENGGWLELDSPAIFDGMKISLADLVSAFMVLADPRHPQNNWSCLAEKVYMGDRLYLHLVNCIPELAKKSWETNGPPPFGSAWLSPSFVESLFSQVSQNPAKTPPAKKAKKAPKKAPAKKPEPVVEETPEQKKKADVRKTLAIAMEMFNARGNRW